MQFNTKDGGYGLVLELIASLDKKESRAGNQSEAYRRTYRADRMWSKTVHKRASRLMKNHKVAARVLEFRTEAQREYSLIRDDILRELDKNRELALFNIGNAGSMNQDEIILKLK